MSKTVITLISLTIFVSMDAIYGAFSFFENYQASYLKEVHPEYNEAIIYTAALFMDVGLVLANMVAKKIIFIAGIKKTIALNGLIVFLTMALMVQVREIWAVYLGYGLAGFTHQLTTFAVLFILTSKYKKNLVKFTGYVFTGSSLAFLMWGLASKFVINPNNLKQDRVQMTSSGEEKFFGPEVTRRVPVFFYLYGLTNLVVAVLVSIVLRLVEGTEK